MALSPKIVIYTAVILSLNMMSNPDSLNFAIKKTVISTRALVSVTSTMCVPPTFTLVQVDLSHGATETRAEDSIDSTPRYPRVGSLRMITKFKYIRQLMVWYCVK